VTLVINRISLKRLILGGAAIFAQHVMNHIKVSSGIADIRPLVSVSLRVLVIS
jgi:hypothetical protein